ncbi:60S acidic ribosomal protein P1 [Scenedesmus sp. PABB004]|nr:60S acidic ribosomal protein P1 [Scenedesmus sp. PABB004]
MSTSELACVYASLILHDDGLEITGDNINTIVKAAGITVEPYWPALFAKLFAKKSVEDLICNVGAGGGAPAAAAAPAAGGAGGGAAPAEAKKEEPSEEDEDMGFSLFD